VTTTRHQTAGFMEQSRRYKVPAVFMQQARSDQNNQPVLQRMERMRMMHFLQINEYQTCSQLPAPATAIYLILMSCFLKNNLTLITESR
jgi:hypothetical protein